jgi:hypothetical protein
MWTHFRHLRLKSFRMVWRGPQFNEFWPLKSFFKIRESIETSTPIYGVQVSFLHIFPHSRECECDSQATFSACIFLCPCFGRESKARVMRYNLSIFFFEHLIFEHLFISFICLWFFFYYTLIYLNFFFQNSILYIPFIETNFIFTINNIKISFWLIPFFNIY